MTRFNPNKLYKDTRNGRFMGVCAGIADYFDTRPSVIRFLVVLGALFTGIIGVLICYVILGVILDKKPDDLYDEPEEDQFWRQARTKPDYTKVDLNRRFEEIERRTRRMEAYMTSRQFRMNREFRDLER